MKWGVAHLFYLTNKLVAAQPFFWSEMYKIIFSVLGYSPNFFVECVKQNYYYLQIEFTHNILVMYYLAANVNTTKICRNKLQRNVNGI